jgi:hypothetical protein
MKKLSVLMFSFLSIFLGSLYGCDKTFLEEKRPFGCCQRYRDYKIRDIQLLLYNHLKDITFLKVNNQSSYTYLYSPELDNSINHVKTCSATCCIVIDEKEDIGDYNPFSYQEKFCPYDILYKSYDIDLKTGTKTPTNWRKIHYSKNGVHIVPTKPRG